MASSLKLKSFGIRDRVSQSLRNDRCENILYKTVFEHFIKTKNIAALLLASKSFQNSSFGANFIVNFIVDENSILLIESVLSPSSCFSLQFVPFIHIKQSNRDIEKKNRRFSNFVSELVSTKYLPVSLRSLTMGFVSMEVLSIFFWKSNNAWPQLQNLSLEHCDLTDLTLSMISQTAVQLRTMDLSYNSGITDAGLERIGNLSKITSLNLCECGKITDAGLEHLSKLPNITFLDLTWCLQITDAGLMSISKLSRINSLNLTYCSKITDAGLEHISNISSITSLILYQCSKISNAGLEHIAKLSSITSLDLCGCAGITDDGLEHISNISSITVLDFSCCDKITDASLQHLSKLTNIKSLNLANCNKITGEAKANLQAALPNCRILNQL